MAMDSSSRKDSLKDLANPRENSGLTHCLRTISSNHGHGLLTSSPHHLKQSWPSTPAKGAEERPARLLFGSNMKESSWTGLTEPTKTQMTTGTAPTTTTRTKRAACRSEAECNVCVMLVVACSQCAGRSRVERIGCIPRRWIKVSLRILDNSSRLFIDLK